MTCPYCRSKRVVMSQSDHNWRAAAGETCKQPIWACEDCGRSWREEEI